MESFCSILWWRWYIEAFWGLCSFLFFLLRAAKVNWVAHQEREMMRLSLVKRESRTLPSRSGGFLFISEPSRTSAYLPALVMSRPSELAEAALALRRTSSPPRPEIAAACQNVTPGEKRASQTAVVRKIEAPFPHLAPVWNPLCHEHDIKKRVFVSKAALKLQASGLIQEPILKISN